ncbi:Nramp family divalent metal transporter [Sphaerisporangium sp. NPDC051011]|uniref:Nramp family divalent metal transporter n=1 Tax=Sphaerisporangium sp. NPDC051011 TaxID=3155792 RepID=UPI00340AB53D
MTTGTEQRPAPQAVALPALLGRGRVRGAVAMLGPAFVAAVAYVDPGNFSTNITAGAEFGYQLVWVVVLANLMAMPVQFLSAKVGVVTGRSLPELCRDRYRAPVRWALWAQAEAVAMATDLAEFIGAAVGLNLLFGVPMVVAGLITAVTAFAVLALQVRGYRPFERAIAALLLVVTSGFVYEVVGAAPSPAAAAHGLWPSIPGGDGLFLVVGIVGATVMPHVVYLHSAMTARRVHARDDADRRRVLRFERWDVIIALGLAGAVNLAMLVTAAGLFHGSGAAAVATLEEAHAGFARSIGGAAATVFAVTLLASGISSSSVGTFSGQAVMAGFVDRTVPLALRRLVTMLPSLAVLAAGLDSTSVLNASQVLLSFGIPFALVPLIAVARDRRVMGAFACRGPAVVGVGAIAAVITAMNAFLIVHTVTG